MIEMLGVLAIIGVLSAGGVWGYNLAMDTHKFNKFVQDVQMMVVSTMQAFPKPYKGGSLKITWFGEKMNKLGIVSDELYKTSPSPTNGYFKNPFTGKIDFLIRVLEENKNYTDVETPLGTWHRPPARTTGLVLILKVPPKICAKILTYNWASLNIASDYGYTIVTSYKENYVFLTPPTVAEANNICNADANEMYMAFFIHASQGYWQQINNWYGYSSLKE